MYCNKCGNNISDMDTFCTKCGTMVKQSHQQPPMQQYAPADYGQGTAQVQDKGFYGRFGGLMIYGTLIIIFIFLGIISSGAFLYQINLRVIGLQFISLLPIAFAVGLTVKQKGLDLSIPAMVAISSSICLVADSLAVGIILALAVCLIIGCINAILIHFLKLPGILATLITYTIVNLISTFASNMKEIVLKTLNSDSLYVVVLIAVVIAIAIALISSIGKDHRNKLWSTLIIYAGSGILSVLYFLGLTLRYHSVMYYNPSWLTMLVLFIAVFLSITRFFISKTLSIVLAIIPVLLSVLISNVMSISDMSPLYQRPVMFIFVIIMLFLLFYRGRVQLIGQSLDRMYSTMSWIAIIPLILLLLRSILITIILAANMERPSMLYFAMAGTTVDVIMLVITMAFSIVYLMMKPKGSTIV